MTEPSFVITEEEFEEDPRTLEERLLNLEEEMEKEIQKVRALFLPSINRVRDLLARKNGTSPILPRPLPLD